MKVRFISAIIVIAILVPFLIIGGYPFAIIISILGMLAYKEILDLKKSHKVIPNPVKVLGLISLIYIMVGDYNSITLLYFVNYPKVIIPIILVLLPTIFYKKDIYSTKDALYLLGSIYLLGFFINIVINIRIINIYLIVYLLSITIFTDTFAYVIGSLIGKHKLSSISPNKSWEGSIAGLIGGVIIPLIIYANLIDVLSINIIFITIFLSIVGQMGDLFFSKIKRDNNIKDFSNIMPGHGGVLDRIDSLTFVLYTYVLLTWLL